MCMYVGEGGVSLAAETEESYEFGPWAERNSVLSGLSFELGFCCSVAYSVQEFIPYLFLPSWYIPSSMGPPSLPPWPSLPPCPHTPPPPFSLPPFFLSPPLANHVTWTRLTVGVWHRCARHLVQRSVTSRWPDMLKLFQMFKALPSSRSVCVQYYLLGVQKRVPINLMLFITSLTLNKIQKHERFIRMLIYQDANTRSANFRGNSLCRATKRHLNNS